MKIRGEKLAKVEQTFIYFRKEMLLDKSLGYNEKLLDFNKDFSERIVKLEGLDNEDVDLEARQTIVINYIIFCVKKYLKNLKVVFIDILRDLSINDT